ncbi:hypothetical protein ACIRST_33720 [Kitasatospora sp. NPDC101447]|uniref:hypothetical protein n=1 Tax=Kitasatospora sp. NPDC101447 TaxID=3364102 RepID=UPI0037FE533A
MPGRTHRSTFTAASAVLALCAAAVVTGCATAGTDAPAAVASGASTPGTLPPLTATPQPTAGVDTASTPVLPPTAPADATGPTGSPTPLAPASATPTTGTPAVPKAPDTAPSAPAGTALTAAVQPAGLAQLPIAPKFGWKPDGPLSSQDVHNRRITLNECAGISGAVTWQQQGYLSTARNPAGQQLFSFPTPEAAHTAYQHLLADMDACQESSRQLQARQAAPQDATVIRTASTANGTSWSRQWTGVGGMSAPEQQTNHFYALQQGGVLTLFQFDELKERPAPAHDTGTDPSVLAALAALGAQH